METSIYSTPQIEKRLRAWLAEKYAPACAVFGSKELTAFLRDNAHLSPAEFLRPFAEVGNLDNKLVQTFEKNAEYKYKNLRLNMVDIHKIDGRYYKDSEYLSLFPTILDIERPKDTEFATLLQDMNSGKSSIKKTQKDLDLLIK